MDEPLQAILVDEGSNIEYELDPARSPALESRGFAVHETKTDDSLSYLCPPENEGIKQVETTISFRVI